MTTAIPSVRLHDNEKAATYSSLGSSYALDVSVVDASGFHAKTVSTGIKGLGTVSVGTSAVELAFTETTMSIIVNASTGNTGVVYVGGATVQSAGTNSVAFLVAGESLTIDYDDSSVGVYVVASVAGQSVIAGALT